MNIIFMGTPDFAAASLKILLKSHHSIQAVVTAPDKPKGRGLKVSESAVKVFASENKLNILQPEKLKEESFVNQIKALNPDLIIVVAFRILPKEIYTIPKYGSFNLHASLLPKYRGAAPINWAIINGETETGITTFFLQDKADTGSIILQERVEISDDDDAGTLHDKLMNKGAQAVEETVKLIESTSGKLPVKTQNDAEATAAPKIFRDDCKIDWDNPSVKVYNFIRGLSPHPGAFTVYNGKVIKVFKTRMQEDGASASLKAGDFSVKEDKIFVSTRDGVLEIIEMQMEGKKRVSAKEFLNGNRGWFN